MKYLWVMYIKYGTGKGQRETLYWKTREAADAWVDKTKPIYVAITTHVFEDGEENDNQ